ncbi:MAG TPA: hypothetical protein VMU57_12590 [Edaphobacter sp.]|uniref:hypothetical protein n=1 Tax=Edaphobacter sp. TaxID=1934404 RepID=UPI002BB831C4|nr:hypothetical protein [Edaphobacter sp.]HUZ95739.1 hypothetical protein [Edaphobacter sp.]
MGHEIATNTYEDLMFGHFNTPAALDNLVALLDWDEMYSAVELPAAALLVPQEPAENGGDMFDHGLYAIFSAERNANGWKVRGIFYCACADGFEGQLSPDCTVLTCDESEPRYVRLFGGHREEFVAAHGLPTQDNLNGRFSGNYGPYASTDMVREARRAIRQIVAGKSLRDALIGEAEDELTYHDLVRQSGTLKHLRGWYRAFRRNQALDQQRLAHGKATKELSSVPAIRKAMALANGELDIEMARIKQSERPL